MSAPAINIGLIGHVDHGKTTLVQALSGKWTDTHSEEIKRGITIRLGYADVVVYECSTCKDTARFGVQKTCVTCSTKTKPLRTISLVDAPGHESLMATMLCGANIMDGALLLVAANESCPQPQTMEHLQALEIVGIDKVIVIQNKIDLVSEEQAIKNYNEIKEFLKNSKYKDAPIVPMSAFHSINLDYLVELIEGYIPTPTRNVNAEPMMFVARSFDINKPGSDPEGLQGGVIGGVLKQGVLRKGQTIEIRPGIQIKDKKDWRILTTTIQTIHSGGSEVGEVGPGGTFAILTQLDPGIVKSDQLVGSCVGNVGTLPPVWNDLILETHLLQRVVGTKDQLVVDAIKRTEVLMLNVNSAATVGVVSELGKRDITALLKRPICAEVGARVTISRRLGQRWRLIGYGIIKKN